MDLTKVAYFNQIISIDSHFEQIRRRRKTFKFVLFACISESVNIFHRIGMFGSNFKPNTMNFNLKYASVFVFYSCLVGERKRRCFSTKNLKNGNQLNCDWFTKIVRVYVATTSRIWFEIDI